MIHFLCLPRLKNVKHPIDTSAANRSNCIEVEQYKIDDKENEER